MTPTSLHSIDFPTLSTSSFVDEDHLQSTKEVPPVVASRTIYDILPSTPSVSITDHQHSTSSSSSSSSLKDINKTLREVLSGIEECHAQCFRANNQQETDAPDLVLNLPISTGLITPRSSKSLDEHIPIVHSTIIIDLKPSPSLERKKIPPPIMKKPEKTMQLMKRLGLYQPQSISISGSSKATEV